MLGNDSRRLRRFLADHNYRYHWRIRRHVDKIYHQANWLLEWPYWDKFEKEYQRFIEILWWQNDIIHKIEYADFNRCLHLLNAGFRQYNSVSANWLKNEEEVAIHVSSLRRNKIDAFFTFFAHFAGAVMISSFISLPYLTCYLYMTTRYDRIRCLDVDNWPSWNDACYPK